MGSLLHIFPRLRAQIAHKASMQAWEMMQAASARALLPPDEFMDGATQAYLYFNKEVTVSTDIDHLEALCTPRIYSALEYERSISAEEGGFGNIRDMMGEDAAPEIHTMESYLTMFIMLSHPKHFQEGGQDPYKAMAEALQPTENRQRAPLDKFTTEEDREEDEEDEEQEHVLVKGPPFTEEMVERWGMEDAWPDHVVTASVRFLTKETYPWGPDDQEPTFKVDNYEFVAPYTDAEGVGNFKIVDFT